MYLSSNNTFFEHRLRRRTVSVLIFHIFIISLYIYTFL
jgi:hypothetical protein